jgi:hypothetical protein
LFVFGECWRKSRRAATSILQRINVANYLRFVSKCCVRSMAVRLLDVEEKKPKLSSHAIHLFA